MYVHHGKAIKELIASEFITKTNQTKILGVYLLVTTLTSLEDYGEAMLRSSGPPEIHPRSIHSDERRTETHAHRDLSLLVHLCGLL